MPTPKKSDPSRATQLNIRLADPKYVFVLYFSQPPNFSGVPNLNLILSDSHSGHLKVSLGPNTSSGVLMTYTGEKPPVGQWTHLAFVRNGNNGYLYLNGIEVANGNVNSGSYNSGTIYLGRNSGMYTGSFQAYYSNVRFTTSALYTSSFKPPTEPLTNITNTKLLCCNNSSTTGSTVTPGTIAVGSVPVASSDSPFDDPEGFKFGEGGDQNIVKTGSYIGNGDTTNGTKIYLGFEPQWLLIKSTGFAEEWHMFDCMRGIVNEGNDIRLEASTSGSELTSADFVDIDASGFTALHNPNVNKNNENFVYLSLIHI